MRFLRDSTTRVRLGIAAAAGAAFALVLLLGLHFTLSDRTTAAASTPIAAATQTPPPQPLTLASLGIRLAYARLDATGAGTLVVQNPDDSIFEIGQAHGVFTGITWSPDGTRIATSFGPNPGSQDIYVMNADGTSFGRLTTDGQSRRPAFSPDGTMIAFVAGPPDQPGTIATMHADGTGPGPLSPNTGLDYPAWAPDGSSIAVSGDPGTIALLSPSSGAQTSTVQLLRDSAPARTSLAWSFDSTAVAGVVMRGSSYAVVVLGDNMTWQRQIGAPVLGHPTDPAALHPSFASGDGSKIIAASDQTGDILVFDINALPTDQPTTGATPVQVLVPAPRGQRLAFPAVTQVGGNRPGSIV